MDATLTGASVFQTLVEQLPAGVFVQTQGRFAHVNREARRILGVECAEDILGVPVLDRFCEAERAQIRARIQRLNERKEPVEKVEETILRSDGTLVPVEVSAIPFEFQGHDGALVFLRDLTQEKQARKTLESKDELLRLTGTMAKVGGWEFDPQTLQGTWTDEVAKIHDVDPSVSPDVTFGISFYVEESRARIEAAIAALINESQPYDLVLEMRSATGRQKWVRTQGYPVVEHGRVVRVRGTFQDVTEAHRSQLAVLEEKERLQVTLASIGDGVITTDTEGRVALMNRTAEVLTGWTQAEAAGRPLGEVFPLINQRTKEPLADPVALVLSDGNIAEMDGQVALWTRDGQERVIGDSAAPIRDLDGKITGVVVVFRDQTEKQRLNEALQRAQNLESIGLLAAGIAHDFNNLLSGLFGQIQLAADKAKAGRSVESRAHLDRALSVFDRARELTNQLQTFSRGGAPVCRPFDVAQMIRQTAQGALNGSNIRLDLHVPDEACTMEGDPVQLAQVVEHLILNARQVMPAGGRVLVSLDRVDDRSGPAVVITVADDGPGIPPSILGRIFDPFFTTKPRGRGLGLTTVQSIIHRHRGIIDVESSQDSGTTFRLRLPGLVSHSSAVAAVSPSASSSSSSSGTASTSTEPSGLIKNR